MLSDGAGRYAAGLGAIALGLATVITTLFLTSDATRRWVRARAVSESIKQQFFRFRANAMPYTDAGALKRLQADVSEIENAAVDLTPYLPVSDSPAGPPPPDLTPEMYVAQRIDNQVDGYYLPRAALYARRAQRLRVLATVLSIAATALATAGAANPVGPGGASGVTPWVAVLTTLGGAVAAYLTAQRYDFLVVSFTATANRLENRLNRWRCDDSPTDASSWSALVDDCENAIAQENESWIAK